jgi:methionyl aminopeptidase
LNQQDVFAPPRPQGIELHGPAEFEGMRRAGQLAAETLDFITDHVAPGVTTEELDRLCHEFITLRGAVAAPLGYRGFPKSICVSVNHEVCHGIPDQRKLREGDIANIDVTVILDGWHGDSSRMYPVGHIRVKQQKLIDVTYDALMLGIDLCKPGVTFGDLGYALQTFVEKHRFSVVRDFCGHGLGRTFHAPPSVLHYGSPGEGPVMQEGMFFTIEPMVNAGTWETKILSNGWTAVTRDRQASAQFEHSIGITATGTEIFTLSPKGLHKPPYA